MIPSPDWVQLQWLRDTMPARLRLGLLLGGDLNTMTTFSKS